MKTLRPGCETLDELTRVMTDAAMGVLGKHEPEHSRGISRVNPGRLSSISRAVGYSGTRSLKPRCTLTCLSMSPKNSLLFA